VRARPQIRVVPSRAVTQTPSCESPSSSVTEQAAPAVLPVHAATSDCGGAGGFGEQAMVLPSSVVRQVPATVVFPSARVRVQAAPAARFAQSSIWDWEGVQSSVPLAEVAEATEVASALEVEAVVRDEAPLLQPAVASARQAAEIAARVVGFLVMGPLRGGPSGRGQAGGAGVRPWEEGPLRLVPGPMLYHPLVPQEDLDALILRAQAGDVRAFEALVAEELPRVRRFARAFAGSEADADDLAQDALVRVYRSLRLYRYQAAFSTWLFCVVRSVFLDAGKGRPGTRRSVEEPLRDEHAEREGGLRPDEALAADEERRRLWAALRKVRAEYRTTLVLFDLEGCSYDEVAAIEGIAVGTVKSRLHRGRARLRELLAERASGEASRGAPAGTSAVPAPSNHRRSR
jgi:RNA polymerase sigma-70 factor (ECF subfamily)